MNCYLSMTYLIVYGLWLSRGECTCGRLASGIYDLSNSCLNTVLTFLNLGTDDGLVNVSYRLAFRGGCSNANFPKFLFSAKRLVQTSICNYWHYLVSTCSNLDFFKSKYRLYKSRWRTLFWKKRQGEMLKCETPKVYAFSSKSSTWQPDL